jgi:hypothetical protein
LADASIQGISSPEIIILEGDDERLLSEFRQFCEERHFSPIPVLVLCEDPEHWRTKDNEDINCFEALSKDINRHQLLSKLNSVLEHKAY